MATRKSFTMVQTAPGRLVPMDLEIPEIDAGSALLRVEACGICGSDHEQFRGVLPVQFPVVPGHEPLGVIAAIGDTAAERWGVDVGDRVAVETMLACHICRNCLAGSYHLCERREIISYVPLSKPPGLWGAYSQYMFLDARSVVHRMDPKLPPEIAVMFNPLGAGFRWAVEIPRLRPGDSVVILGPGQRGLASVIAAREAGAGTIVVTGLEVDRNKLALAREFGADHTLEVENDDVRGRIREITDGRGADVVLDVSAYATEPVAESLDYVGQGGTVVLAGVKGFKPVAELISDKIVL